MGRVDMHGVNVRISNGRKITMFKESYLYNKMQTLSKKERALLDFILQNMARDMNTIILDGVTKELLIERVGITEGTLSYMTSVLKAKGFIDKALLPYEYIVHPTLAICGNEEEVYRIYGVIESQLKGVIKWVMLNIQKNN